jgi:hypothetical protein
MDRPFEEGPRQRETEGELQEPERFAHATRPVNHDQRPLSEPVEIGGFRRQCEAQEIHAGDE